MVEYSKEINNKSGFKERLRDMLGFGADTIQVGQFLASLLSSTFIKVALAATAVGGTAYVGTSIIKKNAESELLSSVEPAVTVTEDIRTPTVEVKGVFESQARIQNEVQKVFEDFKKYWAEGDLSGICTLLDMTPSEKFVQEISKRYKRTLLNWKFFEDVEMNFAAANFYDASSDYEKKVEVPLLRKTQSLNKITLVYKDGEWEITRLDDFLSGISLFLLEVPQDIVYTKGNEQKKVEKITYKVWQSFPDNPYTLTLNIEGGCFGWTGDVYIGNQPYTESEINGYYIKLNEAAVYAVNESKSEEIEIRNASSITGLCSVEQDKFIFRLY